MELSSRTIEEMSFSSSFRGYDREEVDGFVADCAVHASALEERTKIAEVHAAAASKKLAELRSEIDVLLEEATEARRKIIEEARAEADRVLNEARLGSDSIREEAEAARTSMEAQLAEIRRLLESARESVKDATEPEPDFVVDIREGAAKVEDPSATS